MALILIRAEDQGKLLNTIADVERHAGLKVAGKPRIIISKNRRCNCRENIKTTSKVKIRYSCSFTC